MYRKPTHSDSYLDFTSHHPSMHKGAVVKTLFTRDVALSSSTQDIHREQERVCRELRTNNPKTLIKRDSRIFVPTPSSEQQQLCQNAIVVPM